MWCSFRKHHRSPHTEFSHSAQNRLADDHLPSARLLCALVDLLSVAQQLVSDRVRNQSLSDESTTESPHREQETSVGNTKKRNEASGSPPLVQKEAEETEEKVKKQRKKKKEKEKKSHTRKGRGGGGGWESTYSDE
jgi:outer membrane biosynthesis protein TonB